MSTPMDTGEKGGGEKEDRDRIEERLREIRSGLTPKPFRSELVDALDHLIRVECVKQDEFKLSDVDWPKLDYFAHQLKKMIKNKAHLEVLCSRMSKSTDKSSAHHNKHVNDLLDTNGPQRNYSSLINDGNYTESDYFSLTCLLVRLAVKSIRLRTTRQDDPKLFEFVLVLISCLADLSLYEDLRGQLVNDVNLRCLFHIFACETKSELEEKMKQKKQQTNNGTTISKLELDDLKKLWTKMCRFSANICQDKHLHKLRHLISHDFLPSLNKFMDQLSQQQINSSQPVVLEKEKPESSSDLNESNIDFYHAIVRFVKYAYELPVYRNQIIRNRILVFINKYLFKLDKNLVIRPSDLLVTSSVITTTTTSITTKVEQLEVTSKSAATTSESSSSNEPTTPTDCAEKIFITKRYQSIVQDLIKQYLIVLDTWSQSQSFCPEFYNQIIEGNGIEHLHWLQINKPPHLSEINPKRSTTPTSISSSSSTSSSKEKEFKYFDFSLNLLIRFCHNYDACRSEFGRIGGLNTCLSRLDEIGDDETVTTTASDIEAACEYDKMIEMICLSCKTSSNRIRWRDSGNLAALLKLQQKLKSNAVKSSKKQAANIDSTLYNRLLAALCCFIHDHDSMTILYAQGFLDALLFYVNESVAAAIATMTVDSSGEQSNENKANLISSIDKKLESLMNSGENKRISLKKILFDESFSDITEQRLKKSASMSINKKRKADATMSGSTSKTRRLENSTSVMDIQQQSSNTCTTLTSPNRLPNLRHSSTSPSLQMLNSGELNTTDAAGPDSMLINRRNSMSPTGSTTANESCMSLSPTFSVSSPPPPPLAAPIYQYRGGGGINAQQCGARSSFNYYSSSSLSPKSTIAGGGASLSSPPNYLGEEFVGSVSPSSSLNVASSRIQFSPSIDRGEFSSEAENSDDDDLDEDDEIQSGSAPDTDDADDDDSTSATRQNQQEICSFVLPIVILKLKEPANKHQSACASGDKDETASIATSASGTAAVNIESINRTEACVFYVLSQLSHTEKSMLALNKNNFAEFIVSLLKYLKHAKVRNPRALRILNRLTKNPIYFRHFVLALLPYRLKRVFNTKNSSLSSSSSTSLLSTNEINEMNVYLNSNTAFFDASSSFPSFESIEFTLCNNLKSLCISSSDPGYSCLIGMMKQRSMNDDEEKLACALVAPFVLRNSKALCYLMVELNGLELILDAFVVNSNSGDVVESMRHKAIVCLRRILSFLAFKRDLKQLGESLESKRAKISTVVNSEQINDDVIEDLSDTREENDVVDFILVDDNSIVLSAKKSRLAKQSAYFEALLEGPLSVNLKRNELSKSTQIELSEVNRETLALIIELLRCNSNSQTRLVSLDDCKLTLDQCIRLVIACDQYLLADLKGFFIAAIVLKFMSLGSLCTLLKLAWQIDNTYLACACVDFLLGILITPSDSLFDSESTNSTKDTVGELERFFELFFNEIRSNNEDESNSNGSVVDFFRRFLKIGLVEIIKNSSWKFL